MEPHFIDYYIQELLYMRELAQEFVQAHPKVARRLGMQDGETGDPYVERLIQAFSWTSARSQMKIDAAFPVFTQRLLETIYPNYIRPTPSVAVARLFPNGKHGELAKGFVIKRGTEFISTRRPKGEHTHCVFTSSQNVTLYPLEIVNARLTGIPPDIASLHRWIPAYHQQIRGALRLILRTPAEVRINDLATLDRLPVYLSGEQAIASRLFELVHTATVATVVGRPGKLGEPDVPFHVVSRNAVVHEAMEPGQSLLPLNWPKFHGYNLLHEYFACPSRFYFFTLTGLQKGLANIRQNEVEIVILLDRLPDGLAHHVDTTRFALFCTPVVNLFRRKQKALRLAFRNNEALLVPNPRRAQDYEVFSIEALRAYARKDSEKLRFAPHDTALLQDEDNPGRYFTLRLELDEPLAGSRRRYGTHVSHTSSRQYLSLIDMKGQPYPGMNFADAWLWLTNADLPCLLECNARTDLQPVASAPLAGVGLIRPPSTPWAPLVQGNAGWELIALLNDHASAFLSGKDAETAARLRKRLRLFIPQDNISRGREIDSITDFQMKPVTRRLPDDGPVKFGRCMGVRLTVDESGFDGASPYLFGLVLEYWMARLVSQRSYVQTDLYTPQRGQVASWPARAGMRSLL